MGRKSTWKEIHFDRPHQIQQLESCLGSAAELRENIISIEKGAGVIETNMPWASLRRWFSWAGVPLPRDEILVAPKPSWEIYK